MYKFQHRFLRAAAPQRFARHSGAEKVCVHVDQPRHDVFSGAVHHFCAGAVDIADGGDFAILNQQIRLLDLAARLSADNESACECSFQ